MIDIFAEMQRKKVAHRNIKPSNILLMDESLNSIKICNFELAVEVTTDSENLIELNIDACSVVYSSPLVL
jgi:serine/threonine protein kinase